ncbi:hypothetical protein M404DRAFT_995724 [Pisolithus tinctorius Marx 270]|uniref:Uncharacterized protein n=1 Tax=Pisolithus tinctorius Marx 270 TaxID=870435 RepID=A0A0C3JMU6_PISTI|nr:hypothetical protein M404DRAFT_995724 [Pisolithus tinctorius Marx 270]
MAVARFLPTSQRLGSTIDPNVGSKPMSNPWFSSFVNAMHARQAVTGILGLFNDDAFRNDPLVLI